MIKNISLKELKSKLPKIIKEIDYKMDRFIITRKGRPMVLIISINEYESLIETLDILSNKKLMKDIGQAEKNTKKGNLKALDKIEKKLGLV